MKYIFDFVKFNILKGMPSGMLVTKSSIDYDIEHWQHKSYDDNNLIFSKLRSKWCPSTINLLILDDTSTEDDLIKYWKDNDFLIGQRHTYLTYCISVKSTLITSTVIECSKNKKFTMSNYSNRIQLDDYTIFVNDFIKHILYY